MDGSLPEWLAVAFFAYAGVRLYRFMGRMDRIRDLERRLMQAQASRMHRLAAADCVLSNDGISMQELAAQVHEISLQFGL